MKYTAINIGPIVSTLGMARKPRELWAASFLFSHLMKCIIETLPQDKIISPAIFDAKEKNGVGLYPDRVFLKDEIQYGTIKPAIDSFASNLHLNADYFNVMLVSDNYETDSAAIKDLNQKLDCMELFNRTINYEATKKISELIRLKDDSPLFVEALGSKHFPIETLGEIAAVQLKDNSDDWKKFVKDLKSEDKKVSEKAYDNLSKEKLKSYHKYICVVQADGDNVGKTVSHQDLPDGKVKEISEALLQFGKNAKTAIDDFGGLPIYAGGDDLLFIAPVVGKDGTSILKLLDKLNDEAFGVVKSIVENCKDADGNRIKDKKGKEIKASLSFGVSISYYKYPLYEALENARHLLFDVAKKVADKNAIALELRKHSGGTFAMRFSKNQSDLKKAFENMIAASCAEESVVSAVSHKIRDNEGLLKLWIGKEEASARNLNFFKKFMEYNPDKDNEKKTDSDKYKDAILELLNQLFEVELERKNADEEKNWSEEVSIKQLVQTAYGMLRIAKFIKGEEVIDE